MNRYRRLFILLLIALLIGGASLAQIGWQIIKLDAKKDQERIESMKGEAGRDLVSLLNALKLSEVERKDQANDASRDSAIVLTGRIVPHPSARSSANSNNGEMKAAVPSVMKITTAKSGSSANCSRIHPNHGRPYKV